MPKQKAFCRILDYIRAVDEELHGALVDTCSEFQLQAGKVPGVTFLMPTGKLRDEILKLAYSANPDDIYKAQDIFNSLIITLKLSKPEDFDKYKEDIPNKLNQKVVVKAVSGNTVEIDNGKLVPINDSKTGKKVPFVDSSRSQKLNVYELDGKVTQDESRKSSHKYDRKQKGKGGKKGGFMKPESKEPLMRYVVGRQVELGFFAHLKCGGYGVNPYEAAAASLLKFACEKDASNKDKLCPLVCGDACADFYVLFEPYRVNGGSDYNVPDMMINDWFKNGNKSVKYADITDLLKVPSDGSNNHVKETRKNVVGSNVRDLASAVKKAYGGDTKKMVLDELRYMCCVLFRELGADVSQYENVLDIIETYTNVNGSYSDKNLALLKEDALRFKVQAIEHIAEIQCFIKSDAFMWHPSHSVKNGTYDHSRALGGDGNLQCSKLSQYMKDANANKTAQSVIE